MTAEVQHYTTYYTTIVVVININTSKYSSSCYGCDGCVAYKWHVRMHVQY